MVFLNPGVDVGMHVSLGYTDDLSQLPPFSINQATYN